MKRPPEPDPADERPQDEANILMLRVGLALIDDARRGGGFETDQEKLTTRTEELAAAIEGRGSKATPISAEVESAERIMLSAQMAEDRSISARLRADGILLEEYVSVSLRATAVDSDELSPREAEEQRQAGARMQARFEREQFHGKRLLRVLTPNSLSGTGVQVLAVESYDDGLIVQYTVDANHRSSRRDRDEVRGLPVEIGARVRVEDDVGTEYRMRGSSAGGMMVIDGAIALTPAIPAEAGMLTVSSDQQSVEFPL